MMRTCEFVRIALSVQTEFVIGFNLNYGIYYLMVKMALIFHIPESETTNYYDLVSCSTA